MSATYLTPSTTTILVNSANIVSGVPKVYLASSINSIGTYFTIRDSTGNCSADRKVIVSTTNGIFFTNETNLSSFEISQPFSFLTIRQKSTTEWTIINTFPLANQTFATIDSLNIGELNVSSMYVTNFLSTSKIYTDSFSTVNFSTGNFLASSFGINRTPQFPLDVNGLAFLSSIYTQTLGINNSTPTYSLDVIGNANFANTLYLNNAVFRSDPAAPTLNKNDFLFTSSNIVINSTLVIQNPSSGNSNVGIRTTNPQFALDVNGLAFFTSTLTTTLGVNTSTPQYNLDVQGTGFIASSFHSYVQVNGSASIFNNSVSSFWLATGSDTTPSGKLKVSTDGSTWSTIVDISFASSIHGIGYNGTRYVVAGNSGSNTSTLFYTSLDNNLLNWSEANLSFQTYGNKVVWNGSYFLACGKHSVSTNTILKSTDGATWNSSISGFSSEAKSAAWNGYMWVATGVGEGVMYSYDGANWSTTTGTNGFDVEGNDIIWGGSKWYAVGKGSSGNTFGYSENGINWYYSQLFTDTGYGIAYNGSYFLTVGKGGNTIRYSFDGSNWNSVTSFAFSSYGKSVAWNGTNWVLTGKGSSTNSNILYGGFSSNGFTLYSSISGAFTNEGTGVIDTHSLQPSLRLTNLDFYTQNIPNYLYSTNQIFTTPSSIIFNNCLTVGQNIQPFSATYKSGYCVGINNTSPITSLDIIAPSSLSGVANYPICRAVADDASASNLLNFSGTSNVSIWPLPSGSQIIFYYKWNNFRFKAGINGSSFFTGQHANYCVDSNINTSTVSNYVGLIVSSADKGYISVKNDGTKVTKKDAIWITEALPLIKLTDKDMDKAVFGVISNHKNENVTSDGDRDLDDTSMFETGLFGRLRINGLGEGAIWVINSNGNLSNGDYICSSAVPGFGRKQDDDILHNYTVAKITMDCDFELGQDEYICEELEWNGSTLRKAYVGCTYHCS